MTKSFMEEHGSRWLLRAADQTPKHRCDPPPVGVVGTRGDLWRCGECGQHWLIDSACPTCTAGGHGDPPRGTHMVGLAWRQVTARYARKLIRSAERAAR